MQHYAGKHVTVISNSSTQFTGCLSEDRLRVARGSAEYEPKRKGHELVPPQRKAAAGGMQSVAVVAM